MRNKIIPVALAVVVFALGGWLGAQLAQQLRGRTDTVMTQAATVLPESRPLPVIDLRDADGQPYTTARLGGRWTMLFMGFANCGHVCPTTLFTLDQAIRKSSVPADVLFVSVDPERDTPDKLRAYVNGFNPQFIGVTGDSGQLDQLAIALGAPYQITKDDGLYIVDHSAAVFLINPRGEFQALFSAPHDAAAIAADLQEIIGATS
ncbi:MAG: SCO family protein [Gammaproteobacteria bacterium]|nr:SCO family protein [Gammaproteobacteria bacterium]